MGDDGRRAAAAARTARARQIAFTTRQGGVSGGSFASLNLGFATADDSAAAWPRTAGARWRRRAPTPRGPSACASGTAAVVVEAGPAVAGGYLDASRPVARGRRPRHRRARPAADRARRRLPHGGARRRPAASRLAVVHAGWRGLVAGVLEAAAERVGPGFAAVVGPGAGACCYEVGDDVAGPLRARFGDDVVVGRPGRSRDGCARRALEARGSGGGRDVAGLCTICDPERFHSHRRDGAGSGRQAVIALPRGRARVSVELAVVQENLAAARAAVAEAAARSGRAGGRGRAAGGGQVRGARRPGGARRRGHRARGREPRRAAAGQAGGRRRPLHLGLHRAPAEPQGARPGGPRAPRALALDALGRRAPRSRERASRSPASSRSTPPARIPSRAWRRRSSTRSSRRSPGCPTCASRGS